MLATQDTKKKYHSAEKFFPQVDNTEPITFEPGELKYFLAEVQEMIDNNEIIDLPKAIHNAKYFAMLEESEREIHEGKVVTFTEEEWENFLNEQKLH